MANFTITWPAPGPSNSTGQIIEYRDVSAGGSWTGSVNVAPTVGTYTFVGLDDNTVYEFHVINECIYGGSVVSSNTLSYAQLNCPVITLDPNYDSIIGYSIDFTWSPDGPDTYIELDVTLLDSTGTSTLDSVTLMAPTYTHTFTGLSAGTTYQVHVNVKIDLSGVGSGPYLTKTNCVNQSATTAEAPACNTPNLISVQAL